MKKKMKIKNKNCSKTSKIPNKTCWLYLKKCQRKECLSLERNLSHYTRNVDFLQRLFHILVEKRKKARKIKKEKSNNK